jgi:hypothetical protein
MVTRLEPARRWNQAEQETGFSVLARWKSTWAFGPQLEHVAAYMGRPAAATSVPR